MLGIVTFPRVALLIDADNAQLNHLEQILKISDYYGNLKICRAYGDWKQRPLSTSCDRVRRLNIKTIQVDRVAKNSTDKQLMNEARKILRAGDADIFIIVSGDGDFTPLCEEIKQKGRKVVGIGNKGQTSTRLQASCETFYYIEHLEEALIQLERIALLREAFIQAQRTDSLAHIAQIGQVLRRLDSRFESRFGKKKLSEWFEEYPHIFKRHENYISLL